MDKQASELENISVSQVTPQAPSTELIYNNRPIKNSAKIIEAYEVLMKTTMITMKEHDPQHAKYWSWGICEVSDICYEEAHIYYGSEEDKPIDFPLSKRVWVKVVDSNINGNNHLALMS